jgi:ribosomal protein L22
MYFAKLQNVPTSPRKMRLVADMIRGMEVNRALGVLKFSSIRKLHKEWKNFCALQLLTGNIKMNVKLKR